MSGPVILQIEVAQDPLREFVHAATAQLDGETIVLASVASVALFEDAEVRQAFHALVTSVVKFAGGQTLDVQEMGISNPEKLQ